MSKNMPLKSRKTKESVKSPLLGGSSEDSDSHETIIDVCRVAAAQSTNGRPTDGDSDTPDPDNHRSHSDSDGGKYGTMEEHADVSQDGSNFVYLLTFFAMIGGFLFGYDTGVISGAMIILREVFNLNSVWQELVVSVTIGAAALFSPIGGILNDRIGRKPTIMLASALFLLGSVILAAAVNRVMLIIGRLIVGTAIGISSSTIPMYIAECAPCHLRGRLVTLNNMFITAGQCIAGIADGAFSYMKVTGWRYMLGLAAIPALIQFIGMIFMPESPRYLIKKGKSDEACRVLVLIRGSKNITAELQDISQQIEEDQAVEDADALTLYRMLTTPHVRKALLVGCGLQLFQQIIGINTVMYYSATIIKMSGVSDTSVAIWLAALTAFVNFIFGVVGVFLVDRLGRRPLTLLSLSGTFVSLIVLALAFQLAAIRSPAVTVTETLPLNTTGPDMCANYSSCDPCMSNTHCGYCYTEDMNGSPENGSCVLADQVRRGNPYTNGAEYGRCTTPDTNNAVHWAYEHCPNDVAWVATFGLLLYLAFFSTGMGPMPWTINSEIYPTWARSTGNAASTTVNWIANLVIAMTFLSLTEAMTIYGVFWLYSCFAMIAFIFLYLLLPETKGKPLEELELIFQK